MYLKLFFPTKSSDGELDKKYAHAIEKHNQKAASSHPDAGFDLFCPVTEDICSGSRIWIDMQVRAAFINDESGKPTIPVSYYMYPRSSISKTPYVFK